jgi:hypothetical protein
MSFTVAENFSRRHGGFSALETFLKLLNSGNSLDHIGKYFGFSGVQASRLTKELFDVVYVPKQGTIQYLEFQKHCLQREIAQRDELIQCSARYLQYVPGEKNASGA